MKLIKNIFIILVFYSQLLCSQNVQVIDTSNYKALYNLRLQKDTSSRVVNIETVLLLGEKFSTYQSVHKKFNDSLVNAKRVLMNISSSVSEISSVLSDLKRRNIISIIIKEKNKIKMRTDMMIDYYEYEEKTNFNWLITKDTLRINNYKCHKATISHSGRDYIAWFTKEIPISDGPFKFNGLPGLIVKIYDTNNIFTFELTSFFKSKESIYLYEYASLTKKWQKTTKKGYYDALRAFKKDPVNYMINRDRGFRDDDTQGRERIKERAKNYKSIAIELKTDY